MSHRANRSPTSMEMTTKSAFASTSPRSVDAVILKGSFRCSTNAVAADATRARARPLMSTSAISLPCRAGQLKRSPSIPNPNWALPAPTRTIFTVSSSS